MRDHCSIMKSNNLIKNVIFRDQGDHKINSNALNRFKCPCPHPLFSEFLPLWNFLFSDNSPKIFPLEINKIFFGKSTV